LRAALSVFWVREVKSLQVMSVVDTGQVQEPVQRLHADVLTFIMPTTVHASKHIISAVETRECPGNSILLDRVSTHCRMWVFSSLHLVTVIPTGECVLMLL